MEEKQKARTPKERRAKIQSIAGLIFAMLCLLFGILLALVVKGYKKEQTLRSNAEAEVMAYKEAQTYTQEELEEAVNAADQKARQEAEDRILKEMRSLMENGNSAITMLRYFFPDKIVYQEGGGFRFDDYLNGVATHPYSTDNLMVLENGEYEYRENGETVSHKGIDVSSFQKEIDWQAVAQDGIEFAVIRLGLRGYGSGKLVVDEFFDANMQGALEAGLKVGVYFFSQAIDEEEAREEVQFVVDTLAPYNHKCVVAIDVEWIDASGVRTAFMTPSQRTDNVIAFCEGIRKEGYIPMIYGNLKSFLVMLDLSRLEHYDKWFAAYNSSMYYPYMYQIWQYSESGHVEGIEGGVDMNISFYDFSVEPE